MRIVIAFLFSTVAWAQVTGPMLGWLPAGSRVVPIYGLPGAARIENHFDGFASAEPLARIAISPRQDYVLASSVGTGEVLRIIPGVSTSPIAGASANPDRIVLSPRGTAAALWFNSTSHFQIISGLPNSPAVRDIDATFLVVPPTAIAVSDDGQWLAASYSAGVWAWAQDASVHQLTSDPGVGALAFFANRDDLWLGASSRVYSITDIGGNSVESTLYTGSLSPAGLAATFDNSKLIQADTGGTIYSIDLATSAAATFDCRCQPQGVFGIGGTVFRFTSSTLGSLKLFDANAGAIFEVPRPTRTLKNAHAIERPATTAPVPALSISVTPVTTGFLQQPTVNVSIASAFSSTITGTVTLTFASFVGGDDQLIQFSTGGRSANFTIPAGSTQATFAGTSSLKVSTGTVAGTITLTATIPASPFFNETATVNITTNPSVPFISKVAFSNTSSGVQVVVTGFSSTRDMVSGLFHFAPSSNETISGGGDIAVPLSSAFATWYQNSASNAFGSEFTLTVPFNVQGNPIDVVAVTVTLTNSKGTSNPVTPAQ